MGAAYSSLGQTKVLYATSVVLRGAKAKFLRRKPSVNLKRVRRRVSFRINIVPPNANYGNSLGSQNFGIQENIEAFPVWKSIGTP